MAIRQIVKVGDEALRKKAREVVTFDQKLAELLDDMVDTMRHAEGCGLAAPQVGILRRIFVAETEAELYEFVNPKILKKKGVQCLVEGCLSVPNRRGEVKRPKMIELEYFDRFGNKHTMMCDSELSRIVSHENDHLDGILFTDYLDENEVECE